VESEIFQNLVQESIDKKSKNITVDLSKVEFISSWGIGLLVHAYTSCINRNINFHIEGVNAQVMNVLNQLKLTQLFSIV
jgi:anti-anti-sigma factor